MTDQAGRRPLWRVLVHALDRTGPPMLALSVVRWLRSHHPDEEVEVVAFRGGPLERDVAALARVHVVLEDEEAWDHDSPDPERAAALAARLSTLGPASANLLVSVSAGQPLPLLPVDLGPVVTWVVEIAEDLHWLDSSIGLAERTDVFLAGSQATAEALAHRLPDLVGAKPAVVPEFVDLAAPTADAAAAVRRELGLEDGDRLVLGAGIGTHRKGVDLFVEVAAGLRHLGGAPIRFAWVGGERDPLLPKVRRELRWLGLDHVQLCDSVPDLDPWCAAADVFLHTARADAFPLVCLHAALQGTPVVSFAGVGGVEEMFGPHFRGAPFPDVAGLRSALQDLAEAPARRAVGEAQRSWAAERYTTGAAAPKLDRLLRAAAGLDDGAPR